METCKSHVFFPPPEWGARPEHLEFSSTESFLMLLQDLHGILLCEMQKNPHDLFHNFLCFYEEFLNQKQKNLEEFFLHYKPRSYPTNMVCTELNLALMDKIRTIHGCLSTTSSLYLAACREFMPDGYTRHSPPSEDLITQHTVVLLKISIEGRQGYVIFDIGNYVAIPIVVMADGLYPHTGWCQPFFRYPDLKKNQYVLEGDYIVRYYVIRYSGVEVQNTDAIYTGGALLNFMERDVKRNLVSLSYRMLMVQDRRGMLAGILYRSKVRSSLKFFYTDETDKYVAVPVSFDYLLGPRDDSHIEDAIATCFSQMRMDKANLNKKIGLLIEALSNPKFVNDALRLDEEFKIETPNF